MERNWNTRLTGIRKASEIRIQIRHRPTSLQIWLNGVQQIGEGTTIKDQAVTDYCVNFSDQANQDLSGDSRVAANFVGEDFNAERDGAADPTKNYDQRRFKICGGGKRKMC